MPASHFDPLGEIMRNTVFLAIALTLWIGMQMTARADDLETQANQIIAKSQASNLAYEIVTSLTTETGPRLAGTSAETRAREWAVAKLTSLGFANVHVEPFEMNGWERGQLSIQIEGQYAQPLYGVALGRSVGTPIGGITANVIRFASMDELQAAPEGSLTGKLVFIDRKMPRTQDGSGYGFAGPQRWYGARVAATKGAIGVLIRSVGTDHNRLGHTGNTAYAVDGLQIPAAALTGPDADQLDRLLRLDPDLQLHYTQTSRNIGTVQSGNVIGEVTGSKYPDEVVILGAHLDSWDQSTGAVDDGAGVAIITAAAKLVQDYGQPERTIRVILFGAEEPGLYGARAYLAAHKDEIGKITMVTESDFGAGKIWRMDTGVAKADADKAERIRKVLAQLGVTKGKTGASGGSDVSQLAKAGAPAISLRQDGWDYFDLHHTANDTLDKIDPDELRQNQSVYAAYAWMVANMPGGFQPPEEAPSDEE